MFMQPQCGLVPDFYSNPLHMQVILAIMGIISPSAGDRRVLHGSSARQAGIMAPQQMGSSQFAISHVGQTLKTRLWSCSLNRRSRDQIMKLSCQSRGLHVSTPPASAARLARRQRLRALGLNH